MYVLTITYPKSPDASFDFDYFRAKHLPQVGKAFKPFGLGYASVLRGEESVDGGEPAYFATTVLSFATEKGARDAVASKAGKALAKDVAKFTSVMPVMQFNSAVS
ncbi:MAG TPA: EthD family reductase [Sphingomicrobium sp.]|nr:EthD family reductase [Sphingomicrobium sp.]